MLIEDLKGLRIMTNPHKEKSTNNQSHFILTATIFILIYCTYVEQFCHHKKRGKLLVKYSYEILMIPKLPLVLISIMITANGRIALLMPMISLYQQK